MRILYHTKRLRVLQCHLKEISNHVAHLEELNKWALKDQISSGDYEELIIQEYCYIRTILRDIIA